MGRGLSEQQNGLLAKANAAGCAGITTHDVVEAAVAAICTGGQACDDQRKASVTASVSRALRRLVARKKLILIRRPDGSTFYSTEYLSANSMPALVTSLVDWAKSFVRELGLDGASQK